MGGAGIDVDIRLSYKEYTLNDIPQRVQIPYSIQELGLCLLWFGGSNSLTIRYLDRLVRLNKRAWGTLSGMQCELLQVNGPVRA